MKILVLDNYDSFTYNLVYILRELGFGEKINVIRNDKIHLEEVSGYDKILISPGPGLPKSAGILKALIRNYCHSKSILGICLGHQGIAEVFGARLYNMPVVRHGEPGEMQVIVNSEILFRGLPASFTACHYHSWAVDPDTVNSELQVTAVDEKKCIMGLSHVSYDVRGLQFHPESVLTKVGMKIIENWIKH